jgi:hypothetical protein
MQTPSYILDMQANSRRTTGADFALKTLHAVALYARRQRIVIRQSGVALPRAQEQGRANEQESSSGTQQ